MSEIKKVYYTIGEVAKLTGEPRSKIRFWCAAMKMDMKRTGNSKRMFTVAQVNAIQAFSDLSKTGEYTVKGMVMRVL